MPSNMRVVSLLPSATEVVQLITAHCEDGTAPQLVGRSHECDYPAGLEHLPSLTVSGLGGARRQSAAAAGPNTAVCNSVSCLKQTVLSSGSVSI